ncbi:MAG: anthranilate synthase component I [Deltaproteobacteria bacterium]|nr:anthranilate synthase component I [Deltaproteobacteria bacterium]
MVHPSKEEFLRLKERCNVIPVFRELPGDTETPVSLFKKLAQGPESFLLESVEGGERWGRYSFIGHRSRLVVRVRGEEIELSSRNGENKKFKTEPFAYLKNLMEGFCGEAVDGLPRFFGGLVGYMSYDMVRFLEDLPPSGPDDVGMPDAAFMMPEQVIIYDNLTQTIKVVISCYVPDDVDYEAAYDEAIQQIEETERLLETAVSSRPQPRDSREDLELTANMDPAQFESIVGTAKRYIEQGEAIQVVLSQRFETDLCSEPFEIYRALRRINPSPYMYYLRFNGEIVIGASPEVLVRLENGRVALRPIAGTRPRGKDAAEDLRLEEELRADAKEQAEHIMLVDLGRNDVGRVAAVGTVEVKDLMIVERYSHVMHLVSHVEGDLAPGLDMFDVLGACFPAGTVSGAPKVRAMEIINELEPTRRGLYAGAVGYFGFSGNMDFCIAIRTMLVRNGRVYLQVGAGIVADSDPAREYEETVNKGKAMVKALEMANNGLV